MKSVSPPSRLMVLLFTDIAGSVALKNELGTVAYGQLLNRHDALFRELIKTTSGGEIIKDTGDGFLARFNTASDAVNTALRFQYALNDELGEFKPLRVRIGIHLGEVTESEPDIAGRPKLIGLAADIASRIMSLALPGQILLTRAAFDDARQYVRVHPTIVHRTTSSVSHAELPELRWMAHGPYVFQGADEPIEVCEVGALGIAPLARPNNTEKCCCAVTAAEDEILGWRPAAGSEIPRRESWLLERRLGEGGFGEVWLAEHRKTKAHRVYKFCFDVDRLRSFRRELTLFRLLRDALGDRPDIAQIHDIHLDDPPYFLESEFTEAGNLNDWAQSQGGIAQVPVATRIDLLARIADAVAAAHSIGVLHKDIKPSNILVYVDNGEPRPRLADFGIGELSNRKEVEHRNITLSGFTETLNGTSDPSRTGTRLYSPPESLAGQPFTIQGDVYALGVMLYQLLVGDLHRPLAHGWERDITDPLLREDIARCVAGRPEDRFASAADLASNLRNLESRRKVQRRQRLVRAATFISISLAVLMLVAGGLLIRERSLRHKADSAKESAVLAEAKTRAINEFLQNMLLSVDPAKAQGHEVTVKEVLDDAAKRVGEAFKDQPQVEASLRKSLGETYFMLGRYAEAKAQLIPALEIQTRLLGEENRDTLETMDDLASAHLYLSEIDEAEQLETKALDLRRRTLGPDDPQTLVSMSRMALVLQDRHRYDEAEQMHRDVIATKARVLGAGHRETLESQSSFADLLEDQGKLDEALAVSSQASEAALAAFGPTDPLSMNLQSVRASILQKLGKYEESDAISSAMIEAKIKVFGPEHLETLITKNVRALTLEQMKRYEESFALLYEIVQIAERTLGPEHRSTLTFKGNLARTQQLRGHLDEAEQLMRELLQTHRRIDGDASQDTLVTENNLALLLLDRKKPAEAEPMFREMVAGLEKLLPEGHWMRGAARINLGESLGDQNRFEEAEKEYLAGYQSLTAALGENHNRAMNAAKSIADLYHKWGKSEEETAWRAKASTPTTAPAEPVKPAASGA